MRQVTGLIPTYSSDEFGICSALYELGGMVVMHDASGCNSTYTTHDEPRWYDMDSMIYISAISEMEAVLGDDDKLVNDLIETAAQLNPRFIAIVGAPIPYMIGTDLEGLAKIVERRTGIPSIGFPANGMRSYLVGANMAYQWLIKRFAKESVKAESLTGENLQQKIPIRVNILGATPLDFSINKTVENICQWLQDQGFIVNCCMSMNCSLEDIEHIGNAHVNLLISEGAQDAARYMETVFQIPYVEGVPFGNKYPKELAEQIISTAISGESNIFSKENKFLTEENTDFIRIGIAGERISSTALGKALEAEDSNYQTDYLSPFELSEDDLMDAFKKYDLVIADPMLRVICPSETRFVSLPHVGCSGRCFEKQIPNMIGKDVRRSLCLK